MRSGIIRGGDCEPLARFSAGKAEILRKNRFFDETLFFSKQKLLTDDTIYSTI